MTSVSSHLQLHQKRNRSGSKEGPSSGAYYTCTTTSACTALGFELGKFCETSGNEGEEGGSKFALSKLAPSFSSCYVTARLHGPGAKAEAELPSHRQCFFQLLFLGKSVKNLEGLFCSALFFFLLLG